MSAVRRVAALLAVVITAAAAGGCWDYNDPEELLYATGMAFDRKPDGRLHNTIEFSTVKGESMVKSPSCLEVDGDTFYDTVCGATMTSEKEVNWSHMQIVIVSQGIAREDMAALLDMLLRLPLMRHSLVVFVSRQATAGEVMKAQNPMDDLNSFAILGALKAQKRLERAPLVQLYQFAGRVTEDRQSAVLPVVGLSDTDKGRMLTVSGAAVFRGPWLQGFLGEEDTRAMMMIEYGKNLYDLPLPADPGGKYESASVEFTLDELDVVPSFRDGRAKADIFIRGNIVPLEISGASTDPAAFCTVTDAIATGAATELENSILAMIRHTKELGGCDVLGIGNRLRNSDPDAWKQIGGHWREYYGNMEITVKAGVTMRNTGDEMQPLVKGR